MTTYFYIFAFLQQLLAFAANDPIKSNLQYLTRERFFRTTQKIDKNFFQQIAANLLQMQFK